MQSTRRIKPTHWLFLATMAAGRTASQAKAVTLGRLEQPRELERIPAVRVRRARRAQ